MKKLHFNSDGLKYVLSRVGFVLLTLFVTVLVWFCSFIFAPL